MATKHTLRTTIPHGDPDLGAEIECEIAFNFTPGRPAVMYLRNGDPGYPADPAEIEFVSAVQLVNGKPVPSHNSAFADMQKDLIDDLARDWLESDEGQSEAFAAVSDDAERAREYAAELRADR